MDFETQHEVLKTVSFSDYVKGREYFKAYVDFYDKKNKGEFIVNFFRVESEHSIRLYEVSIVVDAITRQIDHASCDCPRFNQTNSCKHVAACLCNYYDEIIPTKITESGKIEIGNRLFKAIEQFDKEKNENRQVKQEVRMEIYIDGENTDSHIDSLSLTIKMGFDRLYTCRERKLSNFLEAYANGQEFNFGKNFIYHPNTCYFSEENKKILDYLLFLDEHRDDYYYTYSFLKGFYTISKFIQLVKNKNIYLNGYHILGYKEGFPLLSKLSKKGDDYSLKFDMNKNVMIITNNLEYIQVDNILYHLKEKEKMILFSLFVNDVNEIIIKNENKTKFSRDLLPLVYESTDIDSEIDDFKISKKITTHLYFDLYRDKIACNVIFYYDDEEINYFDNKSTIIRNKEVEEQVISDMLQYKFNLVDNHLLLEDIDNIGNFIENDLIKLTEKYETYTSEKIKKIQVVKQANIKSTFSIGKDNIMNYSFSVENIDDDEIVNILKAYHKNKKYYKLNSGDILNIENSTDIDELDQLLDDMNIDSDKIDNREIEIPKYRAIYLDSLKKTKYHIVETDNMFDELITKFNSYKDSEISLTKKEEKVLRDYQKDGVKWLYNIDKTGFGGILADEMGLGKSIQTIYYIKELLKENEDYKFLIVSPTSLAYNWEKEFDKFENKMKKIVMVGNRNIRREKFKELDNYNIIITTYGLLREDLEYYKELSFKTVIIDEAQNIKNHSASMTKAVKKINADTKLALTGTPIENSIAELWSIFDFVMPGFLPELAVFDKKYRIKDFDEEGNRKIAKLNNIVLPFILRRRKKDVIDDLPPKIENNIYVELDDEQKKLYLAELEKVNRQTEELISTGQMSKLKFMILPLLTKLRQICIDPSILYQDYKGKSGKMDEFVSIVESLVENGHKILVFTSFKGALELALKKVKRKKITSYVIDGSVSSKKRMELVDKFNSDNTNVFFIMLKAGGTGLNLTSADIVIHLDLWWNPQAEAQATDRTHRIGQTKSVEVIKIITKGTIEEKILELQEKKKLLSDKIIDEESNVSFQNLTAEDIKILLSYDM